MDNTSQSLALLREECAKIEERLSHVCAWNNRLFHEIKSHQNVEINEQGMNLIKPHNKGNYLLLETRDVGKNTTINIKLNVANCHKIISLIYEYLEPRKI